MTFALAVFGAATGGLSAATSVYTTVRDRARLSMSFGVTTRADGKPTTYIDVTNEGHRPTTVRQVGFYAKPVELEFLRGDETEPWATGTGDVQFSRGPVFLEAGKTERWEVMPDIHDFGIHADFPLRAYIVDIRGRRMWGDAAPVVRMLFGDDPPIQADDPVELRAMFEPPQPDLVPAKVAPSWKLWKRRELRKPSAWRP